MHLNQTLKSERSPDFQTREARGLLMTCMLPAWKLPRKWGELRVGKTLRADARRCPAQNGPQCDGSKAR